jgi:hypothetical protein
LQKKSAEKLKNNLIKKFGTKAECADNCQILWIWIFQGKEFKWNIGLNPGLS